MLYSEQMTKPKDRKLGDEWNDWDGDTGKLDSDINEHMKTFLSLAAGIMFIFVASLPIAWYMIKPRVEQYSLPAADLLEWTLFAVSVFFLLMIIAEGIYTLKLRKSFLPYRWVEKFLLFLLPKTVWLGNKFGISRDRVGNSFIKLNNFMTQSHADQINHDRPLILLPRCLTKEARREIDSMINGNGNSLKILTVHGGEAARKAINQFNPTFILALACERDLMSGLKDIAEKIPVIAIPNRRPEGPCKNTRVAIDEVEAALKYIADRKVRSHY
ncbi:MAG: DUF116 domain-containing protein [Nitrospiraceae bacterium]|nr:MAG: DUF116 domain-containing protein [Nitrospiraceae bacterium]